DELIFDGRSFVVRPDGAFLLAGPAFAEGLVLGDLAGAPVPPAHAHPLEDLHQALGLEGIRDYFRKNGAAACAVIGISGGIDSAVVTALAVEALGPENVIGAFLPGPFTSALSRECAQALAKLGRPAPHPFHQAVLQARPGRPWAAIPARGRRPKTSRPVRVAFSTALANAWQASVLARERSIAMGYNTLDARCGLDPSGSPATRLRACALCNGTGGR
ncbi:MAG: hypothetical protein ABDI20_04170, partial [Candidatus Bipolaricaulaceae bacterium]